MSAAPLESPATKKEKHTAGEVIMPREGDLLGFGQRENTDSVHQRRAE